MRVGGRREMSLINLTSVETAAPGLSLLRISSLL